MRSENPHSDIAKCKTESCPGEDIPREVDPGQHPQHADGNGHDHHGDPGGGIEVEPDHCQHRRAQGMAGGEGMAVGLLFHQRREAGLLIGAGEVELGPQHRSAEEDEPRHENGAGDELHKIKSGLVQPHLQQPEPLDVQQHEEQRVADEGHRREPAVEGDDGRSDRRVGLHPVQKLLIAFRCHGAALLKKSKTGVEIVLHIKGFRGGILAQVEGVVGVALFAPLAKGDPRDVPLTGQGHHLPHQAGQIVPLLDQGAPCGPHGRLGLGEDGLEPAQILVAEGAVGGLVHIVGVGGALGVDVEHDPTVKPVGGGKALHTFQGGVQRTGLSGAGVDADADQRMSAHPAQNVAVGLVGVGFVIPDAAGVFARFQTGQLFRLHSDYLSKFDLSIYRT